MDSSPRNWVPPHHQKPLEPQENKNTGRHPDSTKRLSSEYVPETVNTEENHRLFDESKESIIEGQKTPVWMTVKAKELQGKEDRRLSDESKESRLNFYHTDQ